ncbi:MAG: hypothetical protein NTZ71_13725, partial [Planctomycetota bacterium]|nr:hypothetical protein [Planctomycetota bacterium]
MPLWTYVGLAMDGASKTYDEIEGALASTFSATVGDATYFFIGGGRGVNIYGGDLKFVFDWEEFVEKGFKQLSAMGGLTKYISAAAEFGIMSLTTQVGGNVNILYGNNSDFQYSGEDFKIKRMREDIEMTMPGEHDGFPLAVQITFYLGTVGMLITVLLMKYKYGAYGQATTNSEVQENNEILSEVIPNFEALWVNVLRQIEIGLSFLALSATEIKETMEKIEEAELEIAELEIELLDLEAKLI